MAIMKSDLRSNPLRYPLPSDSNTWKYLGTQSTISSSVLPLGRTPLLTELHLEDRAPPSNHFLLQVQEKSNNFLLALLLKSSAYTAWKVHLEIVFQTCKADRTRHNLFYDHLFGRQIPQLSDHRDYMYIDSISFKNKVASMCLDISSAEESGAWRGWILHSSATYWTKRSPAGGVSESSKWMLS